MVPPLPLGTGGAEWALRRSEAPAAAASAPVTPLPLLPAAAVPAEPTGTGGARLRRRPLAAPSRGETAGEGRVRAGCARVAGPGKGAGGAAELRARLRPRRDAGGGTGRRRPELSSGASVAPMRCRRPPGATKEGTGGSRPGDPGEPRGEERGGGAPVGPGPGRGEAGPARRGQEGAAGSPPEAWGRARHREG